MKKIRRKLIIRSETIRTLNNIDLMRARGGGDDGTQSGINCVAQDGRTESGINCAAQDALPMPK
jgi:hypothetical protein